MLLEGQGGVEGEGAITAAVVTLQPGAGGLANGRRSRVEWEGRGGGLTTQMFALFTTVLFFPILSFSFSFFSPIMQLPPTQEWPVSVACRPSSAGVVVVVLY